MLKVLHRCNRRKLGDNRNSLNMNNKIQLGTRDMPGRLTQLKHSPDLKVDNHSKLLMRRKPLASQ
jgi:hypothetical protein